MKNLMLFCIVFLLTTGLSAQIAGPNNGTSFTTASFPGASESWISAGNVATSNNVYATFNDLPDFVGAHTDYIVATGFGFNIPANSTIAGVVVEVERSDANGKTADYSIRLVKGGVIGGNDKSTNTPYPAADAYRTYGAASDMWGNSFSPADINSPNFGVAIAAQRLYAGFLGGPTSGRIDHIRIIVYYDLLQTLPVNLLNFSLKKQGNAVQLSWKTTSESNMYAYEIERSINGREFVNIGTVMSQNQPNLYTYTFSDNSPLRGVSYYRLRMVGIAAADAKYSKVLSIQSNTGGQVSIYPSQWKIGSDLYVTNPNSEKLIIYFFKTNGQMVATTSTTSKSVSAPALQQSSGVLMYKIYNANHILLGSGSMVAY